MENKNIQIMHHPLIQHKIGILRRKETTSKDFRQLVSEIAMLMCYEATRHLPLTEVEIETPICKTTVKEIRGEKDGDCTDPARWTRHGGRALNDCAGRKGWAYRSLPGSGTALPIEYYCKLPADCSEREVLWWTPCWQQRARRRRPLPC